MYEINWTEELLMMTECIPRHPPQDLLNESIQWIFSLKNFKKCKWNGNTQLKKILDKWTGKRLAEYKVNF